MSEEQELEEKSTSEEDVEGHHHKNKYKDIVNAQEDESEDEVEGHSHKNKYK